MIAFIVISCRHEQKKTHLDPHAKGPTCLSHMNQIWLLLTDVHKVPHIKFHGNQSSGSHGDNANRQSDALTA